MGTGRSCHRSAVSDLCGKHTSVVCYSLVRLRWAIVVYGIYMVHLQELSYTATCYFRYE